MASPSIPKQSVTVPISKDFYDKLEQLVDALLEKDQELTHRMELHRDILILTRANYQLAKDFAAQWHAKVSWWYWLRNLFYKPWNAGGGGLQRPEAKEDESNA